MRVTSVILASVSTENRRVALGRARGLARSDPIDRARRLNAAACVEPTRLRAHLYSDNLLRFHRRKQEEQPVPLKGFLFPRIGSELGTPDFLAGAKRAVGTSGAF
jgi:hypothetical protein